MFDHTPNPQNKCRTEDRNQQEGGWCGKSLFKMHWGPARLGPVHQKCRTARYLGDCRSGKKKNLILKNALHGILPFPGCRSAEQFPRICIQTSDWIDLRFCEWIHNKTSQASWLNSYCFMASDWPSSFAAFAFPLIGLNSNLVGELIGLLWPQWALVGLINFWLHCWIPALILQLKLIILLAWRIGMLDALNMQGIKLSSACQPQAV